MGEKIVKNPYIYLLVLCILAIIAMCSYDAIYTLYYVLAPIEWIEGQEYALIDTMVCLFMLVLYGIIYFMLIKHIFDKQNIVWTYVKGHLEQKDIYRGIMMALAVGGYAIFWFMLVDWLTAHTQIFPQTVEEFDQIWDFTEIETFTWVFLSVAILGPIVEEILFRGIIYDTLRQWGNPWLAIGITAVLFGVWHGQPVQMGYTFIAGLIMGLAREYSGGLLFPIGIHILNNALSTLPSDWYSWAETPINVLTLMSVVLVIPILRECVGIIIRHQLQKDMLEQKDESTL